MIVVMIRTNWLIRRNAKMPISSEMSAQEIIQTLKRSSLPTIVVEGRDDMLVYRKLEELLEGMNVSVLPVGGKDKVLEIYRVRADLVNLQLILFVVDKDMWVLSGIPLEYNSPDIFMSDGYSIENDIYVDIGVENLMTRSELIQFSRELQEFLTWYSAVSYSHLLGNSVEYKIHPNKILANKDWERELNLAIPEDLRSTIRRDYKFIVRGKSLIALALRQLSHSSRPAKHSYRSLLETVLVVNAGLVAKRFKKIQETCRKILIEDRH